jgi:hypothetical protein
MAKCSSLLVLTSLLSYRIGDEERRKPFLLWAVGDTPGRVADSLFGFLPCLIECAPDAEGKRPGRRA